jgi:HSP20 family protein
VIGPRIESLETEPPKGEVIMADKQEKPREATKPESGELVRQGQQQETRPSTRDVVQRDPLQLMRDFARDPFQMMREMMRWDPFREMMPVMQSQAMWSPDFDVRETKDSFVFKADLPGTKQDDIEVSLLGNRLQITGRREQEEETKDETYYACERSYGSFTRTFTLPENADSEHISTDFSDGVLTLVVPKQAESKWRKILLGKGAKH